MKIAVIGTGAVGGYFGGRLAEIGNDVTFVTRGETFKSLQTNGLQVKSIDGNFTINPVQVVDSISKLDKSELIIIAVKAWQVKDVALEIKEIIQPNTMVMPLQNGVLAADELSEIIGKKYVIGGLCKILAKIESPGVINHFGVRPNFIFGELDYSKSERIIELEKTAANANFESILAENIHSELWKKFIAICVSGLLAVTKTTYGEILEIPETREMMQDVLTEIYNVSQAMEIRLSDRIVEKTMKFFDTFPYNSTSSLTRDVLEGKPSEIEYQNGTVVKLGKKYNVPTPVNKFVYNSILPMELKAGK